MISDRTVWNCITFAVLSIRRPRYTRGRQHVPAPILMTRRLFTLGSVLSLLLCMAAVGMWVRSCFFHDIVIFGFAGGSRHIAFSCTGCMEEDTEIDQGYEGGVHRLFWRSSLDDYNDYPRGVFRWAGFAFGYFQYIGPERNALPVNNRVLAIPYWAVVLAAAIAPLCEVRRRSRSRRLKRVGHCPKCGYDLRATPDRCPECGYATAAATASRTP